MKKKTIKQMALTAAGCAAILGISAAGVPVHAMLPCKPLPRQRLT
ncbi:hypothetical protein CM49_04803 [Paenibacillus sp. P1XP2]|nr:hypothetical protein CM49_04803 [Paenibacillus sp. P1XP2]